MKKVYMVTYDFKSGGEQKFAPIFAVLKSYGTWWHYIENAWLIVTEETAQQIHNKIEPFLDKDINMLIIEVSNNRQGWLPEKAWEWIRKNVK